MVGRQFYQIRFKCHAVGDQLFHLTKKLTSALLFYDMKVPDYHENKITDFALNLTLFPK